MNNIAILPDSTANLPTGWVVVPLISSGVSVAIDAAQAAARLFPLASLRSGASHGVVSGLMEKDKVILERVYFNKAPQMRQQKMRAIKRSTWR